MAGPISRLPEPDRRRLLAELNYINLAEMRGFCNRHEIPHRIYIETPNGARRVTRDTDRKSIVLERIREFLNTGEAPTATCFAASVVAPSEVPARLRATDRLYYGWYDKKNPVMIELLRSLTDGKFRNGAISRILAREFWTRGEAPTFEEFAKAWLEADAVGLGEHPEAAWLTDRARGEAGVDWRDKRQRIAARVLELLHELAPG